jgi:hypothetical protein
MDAKKTGRMKPLNLQPILVLGIITSKSPQNLSAIICIKFR